LEGFLDDSNLDLTDDLRDDLWQIVTDFE
jgi:hypothetical protein